MKLIKTYVFTEPCADQAKGKPSYIIPLVMEGITVNDPHKMCFIVFDNNQNTSAYKVDMMCFSMIALPTTTLNTNIGGMLRNSYTGARSMDLTNNTYLSEGTIAKVYTVEIPT